MCLTTLFLLYNNWEPCYLHKDTRVKKIYYITARRFSNLLDPIRQLAHYKTDLCLIER